ncbi:MAG: FUSC family protein [Solirubrobacterales bacterium]|nr:FUSC family protein [Solirubrobacterales bacterium]
MIFGEAKHATALAIGALFAGLSDPRGTLGMRARAIGIVAVMNACAGVIGALVATSYGLHVFVAMLVSLVCGYLGVIGPRAATAGVLALVVFIIFAGTVYVPADAPQVALLLLAGAALQAAVSLAPVFTRRLGSVRGEISVAYRALALTFQDRQIEVGSASLAAKVGLSRELIRESRAEGATRDWLDDLVQICERVRVGTFLLEHRNIDLSPEAEDFILRFYQSAASACFAVSTVLEIPRLRQKLKVRATELDEAVRGAPRMPDVAWSAVLSIHDDLLRAIALVERRPWPLGPAFGVKLTFSGPHDDVSRLWKRNDTTGVFVRHAIRLAAVITLAVALSKMRGFEDSYWLPMTVAWVMKPDLAGSATRLVARLAGTLAGAFVFVATFEAFGSTATVVTVIVGLSAFLVFAFIQANYTIGTLGATVLFFTLVTFAGNPAISSATTRVGFTLLAGVCVALAVLVVPTRSLPLAYSRLGLAAKGMADYVDAVRCGRPEPALVDSRAAAALATVNAGDMIKAVGLEPGSNGTEARSASRVMDGLVTATAYAASAELDPARDQSRLTAGGTAAMRSIGDGLEDVAQGRDSVPAMPGLDPGNPFEKAVTDAAEALASVAPIGPNGHPGPSILRHDERT